MERTSVAINYTGAILATMSGPGDRPLLRSFLGRKFNSIAGILGEHDAEIDMKTLSPVSFGARASVPEDRVESLAAALAPLEFEVLTP